VSSREEAVHFFFNETRTLGLAFRWQFFLGEACFGAIVFASGMALCIFSRLILRMITS
jgi:hypothetical protein